MSQSEKDKSIKLIRDKEDRKLPPELQNIELWQTNRRSFLKAAILAGAISQIGFLQSCAESLENGNEYLTGDQIKILKSILLKLFPNDGNGPSAEDLHSYEYILWVLQDPGANAENNSYVIEGIDWANEASQELFHTKYNDLDSNQQDRFIAGFIEIDYGKDWCSILITLILESLLLDPVYGGNPDGIGWKWLNHTPGFPGPTEQLRYDKVIETARSNY